MFDTYVASRLNLWAAWRAKNGDGGLGYPKRCAFVTEPSGWWWTPEMGSACWDTEQCVVALMPERKQAIMQHYTKTGTYEQKAKVCGCAPQTYYNRLHAAHRDILGYLNDLAAGVALPSFSADVCTPPRNKFALNA